jgi:hypothetical protein
MNIQDPPNAIQIELVEGCPLRCTFCGLNGIREKENNYKFLTFERAGEMARRIRESEWNPRLEFAMHGEPTMNPYMIEIFIEFRRLLPRLKMMLTTNGAIIARDPFHTIHEIFAAGIDTIALDDYEGIKWVPKIREAIYGRPILAEIFDYPANPKGNPHTRYPGKRLVFIQDISIAEKGTHSKLNNHAGAGAPKNSSAAGKRCAKPFRELAIRWDGSVALCCNDWRGEYIIDYGDWVTRIQGLTDMWNSHLFYAARQKLYHRERDFGPCNGCDALSTRVGLLPDRMGKEDMPLPDSVTREHIAFALDGGPLTKPVLREWEL